MEDKDYDVIYKVCRKPEDRVAFNKRIKNKLSEGWKLQGGVSISLMESGMVIVMAQAIVKE